MLRLYLRKHAILRLRS